MEEIWKDVPGFEGFYQVSNLGRVKSVDRRVKSGKEKHIRWGKFGKDNPCSKKVACFKNGILIHEFPSYTEAQNNGFSRYCIYKNVKGITSKYKGFVWKELR